MVAGSVGTQRRGEQAAADRHFVSWEENNIRMVKKKTFDKMPENSVRKSDINNGGSSISADHIKYPLGDCTAQI